VYDGAHDLTAHGVLYLKKGKIKVTERTLETRAVTNEKFQTVDERIPI
jgi:hypothetical protein